MSSFSNLLYFFAICILSLLVSCSSTNHNKSSIEDVMKYYDHLIQKLDADSIALLYTQNGKLGDVATGRDSIRKFLSSFKNVQVLSQKSTTTSIIMYNDSATQKGNYIQTDILSGNDTIIVKGEFTTHWLWIKREGWHINHMETKPIK